MGQDTGDGTVEGFGLVFLEAGAQSLPAIAGDIGAVGEVVHDGISGLLVAGTDPRAIAVAVRRLMEDPVLRDRLAEGAKSRAALFSWKSCAANTYGPSGSP